MVCDGSVSKEEIDAGCDGYFHLEWTDNPGDEHVAVTRKHKRTKVFVCVHKTLDSSQ